jgi:hypothetical protein
MSGTDDTKRYQILDQVAVTLLIGKRATLSPGTVCVQSTERGETVVYTEGQERVELVKDEFKRLASHGKVKAL